MTPKQSGNHSNRRGFVAITGVIILTAVLLLIGLATITNFLSEARGAQELSDKLQSRALADACEDVALMKLYYDNAYAGNETISVDNLSCQILAIITNGSARTIQTAAAYNDAESRVKVEISEVSSRQVTSWQEMP